MTTDAGPGLRPIPTWLLAAAMALIALFASAIPADSQSLVKPAPAAPAAKPAAPAAAPPTAAPAAKGGVQRAFRGVELGMDREAVIAALKKESLFLYRGPEDVSLLPSPNQSLIDVSGTSFVKRAYFQFLDGKLWAMILALNPDKIDHYSVYTSLVAKYGEPGSLDPREARWEDAATRMSLERPLTLRYLDLAVFSKLREGSAASRSAVDLERREFLGGL